MAGLSCGFPYQVLQLCLGRPTSYLITSLAIGYGNSLSSLWLEGCVHLFCVPVCMCVYVSLSLSLSLSLPSLSHLPMCIELVCVAYGVLFGCPIANSYYIHSRMWSACSSNCVVRCTENVAVHLYSVMLEPVILDSYMYMYMYKWRIDCDFCLKYEQEPQ